ATLLHQVTSPLVNERYNCFLFIGAQPSAVVDFKQLVQCHKQTLLLFKALILSSPELCRRNGPSTVIYYRLAPDWTFR
ncbi:hypothetical protein, partial [Escherichia coli]|uniref:hypothetical protein n=1 Tax=Escherichia coli TaxID=562 RepID=UPI001B8D6AC3